MESHVMDWPQSLRQVLDPNHGSEDTGKLTPLSTDHDSVEHVTVDHVNVHAAPSTYTGNTASVSPTRPGASICSGKVIICKGRGGTSGGGHCPE